MAKRKKFFLFLVVDGKLTNMFKKNVFFSRKWIDEERKKSETNEKLFQLRQAQPMNIETFYMKMQCIFDVISK